MRIAIFENIMTPGGHEVDFDRILVEELRALGHEVSFYVPEGFRFALDYRVSVRTLRGSVVSYSGVGGIRRLLRTAKRELHRLAWYRQLMREAETGAFDALILPTSTYRYLRALAKSSLRRSPVPVLFILHGINPQEAPRFFQAAARLRAYPKIRPTVLTLGKDLFGRTAENIRCIYPPTFVPRDIDWQPGAARPLDEDKPLVIGFFGQYRREKRLEEFLEAYSAGHYTRSVRLLVQGSTMHPEDAADFERIIRKYRGRDDMTFLHQGLIGADWQRAIADVDALLMPYSAPRYRYHWGGMLFTAIGFQKPVVASDDMNPEVFASFPIGRTFPSGNLGALRAVLEDFINTFDAQQPRYAAALAQAAALYSPENFARRIVAILSE